MSVRPEPSARPDFAKRLAGLGEWLEVAGAGRVWRPKNVEEGWRPYLHGSWTWTAEGWFWVSDDPWGHVTDHYGRWLFHPAYQWVWVPGRTWATAWVAWRWNAEVIGWAPLAPGGPPCAAFWTFVPVGRFVGEKVDEVAFPLPRVPALMLLTRPGGEAPRKATSGRQAASPGHASQGLARR